MVGISEYDKWPGIKQFISVPEALVANGGALGIKNHDWHFLMSLIAVGQTRTTKYGPRWPVVMASHAELGAITGFGPSRHIEKAQRLEASGLLVKGKPTATSKTRYDLSPLLRRVAELAKEAGGEAEDKRWPRCGWLAEMPVGLVRRAREVGLEWSEFGLALALVVLPGKRPGWPVRTIGLARLGRATGLSVGAARQAGLRLEECGLVRVERRQAHTTRYDLTPLIMMLRAAEATGWRAALRPEWAKRVEENRKRVRARAERRRRKKPTAWVEQQPSRVKRRVRARIV